MVAATQAQSLTITINGNDWSQNLVSFEIGFESYQQGTGLILKKGSLVLCNIRGDSRAIDPIDQNDFAVGNTVSVKLPGSVAHPLGNSLKILAPPEVSPINSGIPEVEGNLIVSIPVGCNLSFFRTKEFDDDKTGVTLGTFTTVSTIVSRLLSASGVPGEYSISATAYAGWPYSKNGGSFVDLAGEYVYAGSRINPVCLYCNSSNSVISQDIKFLGTTFSDAIITLGTNDRAYQRQLDLDSAPGTVNISGVARFVQDITEEYPYVDTVTRSDGTKTVTTNYYENSGTIPVKDLFLFSAYGVAVSFPSRTGQLNDFAGTNLYTYEGYVTIESQSFLSGAPPVQAGKEYQFSFYDKNGYLNYEIKSRHVKAVNLYPSGWESLEGGDNDDIYVAATNYQNTIVLSEVAITTYKVDGNIVTGKTSIALSNLFLVDPAADFAENFPWAFNRARIPGVIYARPLADESLTPQNLALKKEARELWTKRGLRWIYSTTERAAAIVNNPALFDESFENKLAVSIKPKISLSTTVNARDTQPPSPVLWGGRFQVKEEQITGSSVFGSGNNAKNYNIQSPFWFPLYSSQTVTDEEIQIAIQNNQFDVFAKIEGQIINGRQYQYLIECDPSLFETIDSPLAGVTVVEPTKKRYFLTDALTWYHTATETYVAFAGIFAGSSSTGSTAPNTYPNLLIAAPVPTAAIDIAGVAFIDTITGSAER